MVFYNQNKKMKNWQYFSGGKDAFMLCFQLFILFNLLCKPKIKNALEFSSDEILSLSLSFSLSLKI